MCVSVTAAIVKYVFFSLGVLKYVVCLCKGAFVSQFHYCVYHLCGSMWQHHICGIVILQQKYRVVAPTL